MYFFDLESFSEKKSASKETVLCIGNFDGIHKGHRLLAENTLKLAENLDAVPGVWCFSELPVNCFGTKKTPEITILDEKLRVFAELGLKEVMIGDFAKLRDLSPDEFIEKILVKECGASGVVCGYNFMFGKDRKGTPETLKRYFGERCIVVPRVCVNDIPVSSSLIRELILEGDVEAAALLLGRDFSFCSEVVHGKALGRNLGFPTVNQLFPGNTIVPRHGVYATVCETEDGREFPAVTNVGTRPSFDDGDRVNCESYLMGFSGDLYGKKVRVRFGKFIRDEKKFDGESELIEAIGKDIDTSLDYFNRKIK